MNENGQAIAVSMTAQEWNTVIQLLAEQPFRIAAPLIAAIQMQCAMHRRKAADAERQLCP